MSSSSPSVRPQDSCAKLLYFGSGCVVPEVQGPSIHAASPAAATAKYTVSRALSPLSSSSSYPTVWGRNTVASNHHHHQIYSAQ